MTIALKHERIKRDLQKILKIKAIINKHEWKETNLLSESKDWKKFEKNNETIIPNVLFVENDKGKINQSYNLNVIQSSEIK